MDAVVDVSKAISFLENFIRITGGCNNALIGAPSLGTVRYDNEGRTYHQAAKEALEELQKLGADEIYHDNDRGAGLPKGRRKRPST